MSADNPPQYFTFLLDLNSPGNSNVDGYMSETRGSNVKKRRCPEQHPSQANATSQPQAKRPKLNHSQSQAPAAFWDSLSKLWLTKRALKELDRRNAQSARGLSSSYRRLRRPLTRHALAEFKKGCPHPIPASTFLSDHCTAERLKEIKQSSKQGGPDLSDLRGVCTLSNRHPRLVTDSLSL